MATLLESTVHQRARHERGSSDFGVHRGRLTEEIGNGTWELLDEIVFAAMALAVMNGSGIGHGGAGASASGVSSGTSETRIETCCAG